MTTHKTATAVEAGIASEGQSRWEVLCELFAFLERESVSYVVLGDYTKVRDAREGDVDIAVSPQELRRLPKLLVRFATRVEARVVQSIRHESSAYFFVLAWQGLDRRTHLLQIDACSDYRRSSRTLLESSVLIDRRRFVPIGEARVSIPAPAVGLAYYLVKKVEKDEIAVEHAELLTTMAAEADPAKVRELFEELFGKEATNIVVSAMRRDDWDVVRSSLPKLRAALHERRPHSRDSLFWELGRVLQRLFVQTGFQVVVFGPDGSGKSTVIAALRKELGLAFWGTQYFHLRPRLGTGVEHGKAAPVEDPHGQEPRSAIASVLKLGYYGADYIVGHWSTIKPLLLRSRLVIFDRYYHDILVDPIRYRYAGPTWIAKLVGRFIPRPDLYMFLDAPADIIQKRKTEVSREETERQTAEYRRLALSVGPSVVIDASAPIDDVTSAAVDTLLDRLAERLEKRFWLR